MQWFRAQQEYSMDFIKKMIHIAVEHMYREIIPNDPVLNPRRHLLCSKTMARDRAFGWFAYRNSGPPLTQNNYADRLPNFMGHQNEWYEATRTWIVENAWPRLITTREQFFAEIEQNFILPLIEQEVCLINNLADLHNL